MVYQRIVVLSYHGIAISWYYHIMILRRLWYYCIMVFTSSPSSNKYQPNSSPSPSPDPQFASTCRETWHIPHPLVYNGAGSTTRSCACCWWSEVAREVLLLNANVGAPQAIFHQGSWQGCVLMSWPRGGEVSHHCSPKLAQDCSQQTGGPSL